MSAPYLPGIEPAKESDPHAVFRLLCPHRQNTVICFCPSSLPSQYAPDEIQYSAETRTTNLEALLAPAILAAAKGAPTDSAEAEFAANWAVPEADFAAACQRRVDSYLAAVAARLAKDAPNAPFFE